MQVKDPNHNFRIRAINRNLSNASSLVRSQSLGQRRLSLTHHYQMELNKKMDYLKVPDVESPILPRKKKQKYDKQSKRIIPKLHLSPGISTTIKHISIPDNSSKVSIEEPIFLTYSFNQCTYQELIKRESQDMEDEEWKEKSDISFGFWPKQGKMVLIKQLNIPASNQIQKSLSNLNHRGLVEYFGVEIVNEKMLFLSEHMGCGNLQEFVQDFRKNESIPFNENLIKKITRQLVNIILYMHDSGYAHGNIRSSKILLCQDGSIKLSLVSSMAEQKIDSNSPIKKILWNSPERVLKQVTEKAGDIWGIGMVVLYLATKKKPWCFRAYEIFKNSQEWIRLVQRQQTPRLPLDRSEEMVEFLNMCLKFDPKDRKSARELSESSFLSQP